MSTDINAGGVTYFNHTAFVNGAAIGTATIGTPIAPTQLTGPVYAISAPVYTATTAPACATGFSMGGIGMTIEQHIEQRAQELARKMVAEMAPAPVALAPPAIQEVSGKGSIPIRALRSRHAKIGLFILGYDD